MPSRYWEHSSNLNSSLKSYYLDSETSKLRKHFPLSNARNLKKSFDEVESFLAVPRYFESVGEMGGLRPPPPHKHMYHLWYMVNNVKIHVPVDPSLVISLLPFVPCTEAVLDC